MKVSVYIPSYNNARYLADCVDSVLAQTYQDFEIIIADDGSTDGSIELLTQYQSLYPDKISILFHPGHSHKGFAATCNLALQYTNGEYIARNDSDDIWMPDKLAQQIFFLDEHPDMDFVYSYTNFIDTLGIEQPGLYGNDVTGRENPLEIILVSQCIPEPTVVFRRAVINHIGMYDESIVYSDWDLMVRIFSHCRGAFIDRPLAKYRIHSSNMSKSIEPKINLERILTLFHRIEEKSIEIGGAILLPRNLALLDLQIAFHEFCSENYEKALTYLHRAFQRDPYLSDDINFVHSWLCSWKPDFYTYKHKPFEFWVISHLPSNIKYAFRRELFELQLKNQQTKTFFINRAITTGMNYSEPVELVHILNDCSQYDELPLWWKYDIMKEIYPALLFQNFNNGNMRSVRHYLWRCIKTNPSWLLNKGVWSIGIKAYLNLCHSMN